MQDEIKKIISVVIPYSIGVPATYLYFYWKQFNIQPFEFISLPESISYGFRLFIIILLVLIPLALSISINVKKDSKIRSEKDKWLADGIALFYIVIFNLLIILLAEMGLKIDRFYFFLGSFLVVICALILSYESDFKEVIRSNSSRVMLFLILSLSPCFAVYAAASISNDVINSCSSSYILASDLKEQDFPPGVKLIYLGKLSDQLVFFRKDTKQTIMLNISELKYFSLRKDALNRS